MAFAVGAAALGAAAWLLLGPWWAIAGVAAGLLLTLVAVVFFHGFGVPDVVTLLNEGRPDRAAAQVHGGMPELRTLARVWPGQFRDFLASHLIFLSAALNAMHRDAEALQAVAEAVSILQELAAGRPDKYERNLANALDRQSRLLSATDRPAEALAAMEVALRLYRNLAVSNPAYLPVVAESLTCRAGWLAELGKDSESTAARNEAAAIYRDRLAWPYARSGEARVLLRDGELLCRQGRYREAAGPLARGWNLANAEYQEDALWQAAPALRAAYNADPDGFAAVWHAETGGGNPPDWLRKKS